MALHKPMLSVSFFSGDVGAGLGPYLAIYLMTMLQWGPGKIGIALTITSLLTVLVQTPAGALVDSSSRKKSLLRASIVTIAVATVTISLNSTPWVIYLCQGAIGVGAAFLGPTIAAMTMGIVGPERFTEQTGANQAWNHAGNVVAAILAGGLALWVSELGVFWLVAVMAIGMLISLSFIKNDEIDDKLARGDLSKESEESGQPSGFASLLQDRRLIIFAICIVFFHFSNAAMLPLVSQKLSAGSDAGQGIAFTSACIIAAQFMMVLMAILCGKKADKWGRKPLFLLAFAVLPVRALLFSFGEDPIFLIVVQAFDGVANGIFGIVFLLIIADLTRGTGRFNVVQGAMATLVGIGTSLSNLIAEELVEVTSFHVGFLFLGGVGLVGLILFALFMPETVVRDRSPPLPSHSN